VVLIRANWDGHPQSTNFLGTTEVINNDPDTGKLLKVAFAPRRHQDGEIEISASEMEKLPKLPYGDQPIFRWNKNLNIIICG
jgi:hypothetical protein